MRATASLGLGPPIGPIDRRLFGSFVEHMGRCVYSGIYEPGHPRADADGFREDVIALVRELGVTVIRYPGGNFVSGYRWEDGVGPRAERPSRLNLAWHARESNAFGLDEFIRWAAKAGVEPMLAVNLGTRGVEDALALLEYANHAAGTQLSDWRVQNGAPAPHGVRMWCLGNEMDGPWQLGHKTASEYGRIAAETARAMRQLDATLELVVCGSSGSWMPTFIEWESTVLEATYDLVDCVSLHAYFEESDGDRESFLASGVELDRFIETVARTADEVGARLGSSKRMLLSVDEWNVWYLKRFQAAPPRSDWPLAPHLSEDDYTVTDAVVVGALLISLLKHADRVSCACLAQLVNTIAPIRTDAMGEAWRQATFYPFSLTARYAVGVAIRLDVESAMIETSQHGPVPAVDAVATIDEPAGVGAVFAVNRSTVEPVHLELDLGSKAGLHVIETIVIGDDDPYAANTVMVRDRVVPRSVDAAVVTDGCLRVVLPPASWILVRLQLSGPVIEVASQVRDAAGRDHPSTSRIV